MIIADVRIPTMFTAYKQEMGYTDRESLHKYQYSCACCGQTFAAAWGIRVNMGGQYEKGGMYYCPECRYLHGHHDVIVHDNETAPLDIRLAVHKHRDYVSLKVSGTAIYFTELFNRYTCKFKEEFRFNVKTGIATFTAHRNKDELHSFEIGNPFKLDVFRCSILSYFVPFSVPLTSDIEKSYQGTLEANRKKDLQNLLKVLRGTIQEKLERKYKQKLPSLYCSHGTAYGMFLLPLFNIAYRLAFPYADNLPVEYRWSTTRIARVHEDHIQAPDISDKEFQELKDSYVSKLIEQKNLPNVAVVRKLLHKAPLAFMDLVDANSVCTDVNHMLKMYEWLSDLDKPALIWLDKRRLITSLINIIKPKFGEAGVIKLLEKFKRYMAEDALRMYDSLNAENRDKFKLAKIRLRDLHDWIMIQQRLQNHKLQEFDIPEHVVKRLSMQVERLQFFLPKKSTDLVVAGTKLHNCVASYVDSVVGGRTNIVLVSDDNGKLTACLEVRGKTLVQAKLNKNRPVSDNAVLNGEVLGWARSAGLKIGTSDVRVSKALTIVSNVS